MKYVIVIGILFLGCSSGKQKENTTVDTLASVAKPPDSSAAETDCVFNNDLKGVTAEWIKELGKTDYVWQERQFRAALVSGKDSVFLTKGGCVHFGTTVQLKIDQDNHALTDSLYWTKRSLALAEEFKMDDFTMAIKEGKIKISSRSDDKLRFDVEDHDPSDNNFLVGIEIVSDGKSTMVTLSQYYN